MTSSFPYNPVLKQRILAVVADAPSGSLDALQAMERIRQEYDWSVEPGNPFPNMKAVRNWQKRMQDLSGVMASQGLLVTPTDEVWTLTQSGRTIANGLAEDATCLEYERGRRAEIWEAINTLGGPSGIERMAVWKLGLRGDNREVFSDRRETAIPYAPDGIAVSILRTDRIYDDQDPILGVTHNYPRSGREHRDQSDVHALRAAHEARLPVFVITRGTNPIESRLVRRGFIEDMDDARRAFWVAFNGDEDYQPVQDHESEFDETDTTSNTSFGLRRHRPNQTRFAFQVFKRYGQVCAVCGVNTEGIVQAAHIIPKKHHGSDDPRNGLALCANHHLAFDQGYWAISPETPHTLHARKTGPTLEVLGIVKSDLMHLPLVPHVKALTWMWNVWSDVHTLPDPGNG
jgi:hypothetical protein